MEFRKQFYRQFLTDLLSVLGDEQELINARKAYTQNEQDSRRYNCQMSFGLESWETEKAIDFSAAVFEALASASAKFMNNQELAKNLEGLYNEIKDKLVPDLVKEVDASDPLSGVKKIIQQRIESYKQQPSLINNPYVFYGGIAVVALATLGAIAISPSNGPK